jgi:hypothetical protein
MRSGQVTIRSPIRAVLASEFWPGATARGIVPGVRAAGWLVDEVDISPYFYAGPGLFARIDARLRRPFRRAGLQRAILASASQHRADVFLTVKGVGVDDETLAALRQRGILTANYYPDIHFDDVAIKRVAQFDVVATTKSFQVEPLSRIMPPSSVNLLHHGYTAEVHRALSTREIDRRIDILYVGNASPGKAALMTHVADAFPDANIRIYGNRWEKYASGTALARVIAGHPVSGDFYAAEIARAKIVLAFHWEADPRTGGYDRVSTRTFEIPACGGFMLHIDNDEVRSLYDVPSEIDTFTDTDDLVAKVRYWLAHPEERAAVAARGYARAVPAYSYTERGRELAALIERKLGRKPT